MALGAAENDQLLGVEESKASGFKVWGSRLYITRIQDFRRSCTRNQVYRGVQYKNQLYTASPEGSSGPNQLLNIAEL